MIKILTPIATGQFRHLLTALGGSIVANGYITSTEWETLSGAAIILFGMVLSAASKYISAQK